MTGPRHADRPEHTLHPDQLEVAPGFAHETLQGWIPELANEDELREALEKAFDYRGDVTITRKDGTKVEGYIFDRVTGTTLNTSFVRLLPKDSNQRMKICYAEIASMAFVHSASTCRPSGLNSASSAAAIINSMFRSARTRSEYFQFSTSPCSVILSSPEKAPGGCATIA